MRFSPTITDLMTSPISAAHALVHHRVNTRPLLDVSQAAPSYPPPQVVIDAIAAAASDPSVATYAPQPGLAALRSAFAADLSSAYGGEVVADDVLITDVHEALKRVGGTAIAIRADEEAPWELVGKVLFTAQQAGYEDIQLVAVSRASL